MAAYAKDILFFVASAVLYAAYEGYFAWRVRRDPGYGIQRVNQRLRRAWVAYVLEEERRAIVAIQTLRNSTMSATFLASTAVLLMLGTLNLTSHTERLSASWHILTLTGATHPGLWIVKVLALVIDFFVAFFSFAMAIRLFNHAGYQLTLAPSRNPMAVEEIAIGLNRAGRHYTIGMRAYHLSVPLVGWLFDPLLMLGGMVAILLFLAHLDRAPKHRPPEEAQGETRRFGMRNEPPDSPTGT